MPKLSLRFFPLRSVLAAVFALGLMLQPVLAFAGELHEMAHDSSGKHAGPVTDVQAPAFEDLSSESADESAVLHVLLQCAHCCGAGAAVVPVAKPVDVTRFAGTPIGATSLTPPTAPLPAPFKPPIHA